MRQSAFERAKPSLDNERPILGRASGVLLFLTVVLVMGACHPVHRLPDVPLQARGETPRPASQSCVALGFQSGLESRVHRLTPSSIPLSTAYDVPVGRSIVDGFAQSAVRHFGRIGDPQSCGNSVRVDMDRIGFKFGMSIFSKQVALVQLTVVVWRPGMAQPQSITARGRGVVEPSQDNAWAAVAGSVGVPAMFRNKSEDFFESHVALAWARAVAAAIVDFERQASFSLGIQPVAPADWLSIGASGAEWNPAWDQDWDARGPDTAGGDSPRAGAHLHDGLFLRVAFGTGYGFTDLPQNDEWRARNSVQLQLGWAVVPGLILAADFGTAKDVKRAGPFAYQGTSYRAGLIYYPWPEGGLHVGGGLGYGKGLLSAPENNSTAWVTVASLAGLSWRTEIGKAWWVSDNWSLGGALAVEGARLSGEGQTCSYVLPSLGFQATFN